MAKTVVIRDTQSVKKKRKRKRKKLTWWRVLGYIIGIILILIFIAIAGAGGLIGYLTIREYDPAETIAIELENEGSRQIEPGSRVTVLTFNTGYAVLDKDHDFFMDGGTGVNCDSASDVSANISGIANIIRQADPDVVFLQEVDVDSHRSANINQKNAYAAVRKDDSEAFAYNFKVDFIPYPVPEFMGKVQSGIYTLNRLDAIEAERIKLPTTFTWPMRVAQLKRCLLIERVPLQNSDRELVLVNLHLEAYDEGDAKIAQTKLLASVLKGEYAKGNYVIAGGDFNQTFPNVSGSKYEIRQSGNFVPGELDTSLFESGWHFSCDASTPTCRLLNMPYDPTDPDTQYYVLDGFITSPNVQINSVKTLDKQFEYSDHNPVLLDVTLVQMAGEY